MNTSKQPTDTYKKTINAPMSEGGTFHTKQVTRMEFNHAPGGHQAVHTLNGLLGGEEEFRRKG